MGGQRYWSVTPLEILIKNTFKSPFLKSSPETPSPRPFWKSLVYSRFVDCAVGAPGFLEPSWDCWGEVAERGLGESRPFLILL